MSFSTEKLKALAEHWKNNQGYLDQVKILLDIYNGNLWPYVHSELLKMFTRPDGETSPSYAQAVDRMVPVNILQRIIKKQSKIYSRPPKREVTGKGVEAEQAMLDEYVKLMFADRQMSIANQMFNLFNCAAVEPAAKDGRVLLRPVLNSNFLPYSDDSFDPTNPTVFILYHGKMKTEAGDKVLLRAYSKDSIAIFDTDGMIVDSEMVRMNLDGSNPIGILPFEYFNRKQQIELIPTLSKDTYAMSVLIPLLLTDVAFAIKFQAFSILYSIDVEDGSRPFSPNVLWNLKSDSTREARPEIGSIKPTVDSDKAIAFIQATLAFWLQTKGIRPGVVGQLTTENFSSGISKMIDEMDTFEDRQEQVIYFSPGEANLWKNVLTKHHPNWQAIGSTPVSGVFAEGNDINVTFPEQLPMIDRPTVVDTLIKEVDTLKIESRSGALKRLEPHLSDAEVADKLKEVDEERAANAGNTPTPPTSGPVDTENTDTEDEETEEAAVN